MFVFRLILFLSPLLSPSLLFDFLMAAHRMYFPFISLAVLWQYVNTLILCSTLSTHTHHTFSNFFLLFNRFMSSFEKFPSLWFCTVCLCVCARRVLRVIAGCIHSQSFNVQPSSQWKWLKIDYLFTCSFTHASHRCVDEYFMSSRCATKCDNEPHEQSIWRCLAQRVNRREAKWKKKRKKDKKKNSRRTNSYW